MNLALQPTLQSLKSRLTSFSSRADWRIAVYSTNEVFALTCVESVGSDPDAAVELVARTASIAKTTIVGDIKKLAESLKQKSNAVDYLPLSRRDPASLKLNNSGGSIIAAPCFDPWQNSLSGQVTRRVIGVLVVWGNLATEDAVNDADLRYLVEQYSEATASVLRSEVSNPSPSTSRFATLPDIKIVSFHGIGDYSKVVPEAKKPLKVGDVVVKSISDEPTPKFERIEIFPDQAVQITGTSEDFEPFKNKVERWLQFGPGLAVSKAGLDAFARGWAERQGDDDYIETLNKIDWP